MDGWTTFFPASSFRESGSKTSIGGTSNTDTQVPVWLLALQVLCGMKEGVGTMGAGWAPAGKVMEQEAALMFGIPLLTDLPFNSWAGPVRGGGDSQARGQGFSERVVGGVTKNTNHSEAKNNKSDALTCLA